MRHDHRQILEQLTASRTFAGLPPDALRALAYVVERVTFEPGDSIFEQGDAGEAAYVVLGGEVAITSGSHVVARLGAGELFGELALFGGGTRMAAARAETDVELAALPYEKFMVVVRAWPEVSLALLRLQTERLADAQRERLRLLDELAG